MRNLNYEAEIRQKSDIPKPPTYSPLVTYVTRVHFIAVVLPLGKKDISPLVSGVASVFIPIARFL